MQTNCSSSNIVIAFFIAPCKGIVLYLLCLFLVSILYWTLIVISQHLAIAIQKRSKEVNSNNVYNCKVGRAITLWGTKEKSPMLILQ